MSDLFKLKKFESPSKEFKFSKRKGLSPADAELLPYLTKERDKGLEISPLEFLSDLLSIGQYSASNLTEDVNDILTGKKEIGQGLLDTLQGQLDAFTFKRKGDWGTTIFGGKDPGEKEAYEGILPTLGFNDTSVLDNEIQTSKIPVLGQILGEAGDFSYKDLIGFVGNIVGDPSTYMSWGGSSAGKAAAKEFAEQVSKAALKGVAHVDDIAKMTKKGFSMLKLQQLASKNVDDAAKYLSKYAGKASANRMMGKVWKNWYDKALNLPAGVVQEELLDAVKLAKSKYLDDAVDVLTKKGKGYARELLEKAKLGAPESADKFNKLEQILNASKGKAVDRGFYKKLLGTKGIASGKGRSLLDDVAKRIGEFDSEVSRIGGRDFLENIYGKGKYGQEIVEGLRAPAKPRQALYQLKENIKKSRVGQTFTRAIDAFSTTKVGQAIDSLKSAFGIRNGYQEMLNAMKIENSHTFNHMASGMINQVDEIMSGVDDETRTIVRDVMDGVKRTDIVNVENLFAKPELWEKYGINEKNINKIKKVVDDVKSYTTEMRTIEADLAKEGLMADYTPIVDYLPHVDKGGFFKRPTKEVGAFGPNFTKRQTRMLEKTARADAAVFETFLGVTHDEAMKMVKELNWGTKNMDLAEMLKMRGIAHSKAVANANLVRQFKEFGVKFDTKLMKASGDPRALGLVDNIQRGMPLDIAGMRQIQTSFPALKNMYFDEDVAKIMDRVIPVVSTDQGMNAFVRIASKASAWWKNWALLSPGYHIRNAKSNMFTMFMKDGVTALDPRRGMEALYATAYALHGDDVLKNLNIGGIKAKKAILHKREMGKFISEWADIAKKNGLISKAQMGYLPDAIKDVSGDKNLLSKLNPFDTEKFVAFKGSHEAGAIVESTPKFQSFMNSLRSMAGDSEPTDAMIKYAIRDTKKWFFDYTDLSDFEKNVMGNIIPFYTWARKNIALQVTNMMENRARMSLIPKFQGMLTDKTVLPEDLPEYMRKENYIPHHVTEDGKVKVFNPNLPYEDLNMLPFKFTMNESGIPIPSLDLGEAYNDFLSSANPIIKTVLATAGQGYDPFRRRDLEGDAPAPRAFRFLAANPNVLEFMDASAKWFGMENGLGLRVDDDGKLVMDAKIAKVLEDNFLLMKRIDDLGDSAATILPQIEDTVEEFTGTKHPADDLTKMYRAMSFSMGLTQREYDQDQENERKFREMLKRAEANKQRDKNKIPGYKARSDRYYLDRQKRMMKLRSAIGR